MRRRLGWMMKVLLHIDYEIEKQLIIIIYNKRRFVTHIGQYPRSIKMIVLIFK